MDRCAERGDRRPHGLRVVNPAAEPLVAEAAHLVDDGEERTALLRQRVLDPGRRLG